MALVLTGCGDGDDGAPPATSSSTPNAAIGTAVTSVPRPASVPESAIEVTSTAALGQIDRRPGATPVGVAAREIVATSCEDGVLTIETDQETVFAALPCDRYPAQQIEDFFLGNDSAITLEIGQRLRVLIETLVSAQLEFTVAGIWLQE